MINSPTEVVVDLNPFTNLVRFGVFELDLRARELRKAGLSTRVPEQSIKILALLIEKPGEVVLRDRQVTAKDGMFVIIMTIDRTTGKLTQAPDILSRGFIYMKGSEDLLKEVKHEVRKAVESKGKNGKEANWAYIRSEVRDQIGEFLFQRTERRPMVLPVVIEV